MQLTYCCLLLCLNICSFNIYINHKGDKIRGRERERERERERDYQSLLFMMILKTQHYQLLKQLYSKHL